MRQKYLVTPALVYANGHIHLGHLLEHIQVNIFVRALRMDAQDVLNVCGADSHGTPIEMSALKAGVPPEQFAADWQKKHEASLRDFGIEFDGGYGSTHTKENEEVVLEIFSCLQAQGFVKQIEVEHLFDPEQMRFLPDRMVRGICPKCHAKDQYGDSCEVCGAAYQPTELIEPKSALSGATPILKKSVHYFVSLAPFEERLKEWLSRPKTVHKDVRAYLNNWFLEGLRDWDISRDGPYFGFPIPGEKDKFFYVWLDAPIGYISLTEIALKKLGGSANDYWRDPETQIIHFIGKDIVYFHTLFWPAMLMSANFTLPKEIVVHGMLTIDGEKMSKSRGTFILADTFKKHINSEALRYYFACRLSKRAEDIDLNFGDFIQRVNTDLVNKVVNLVSRALPLLHRYFDGKTGDFDPDAGWLLDKAQKTRDLVKAFYLDNEPGHAINEIVRLSEDANKYLQDGAPWKLVNDAPAKAHEILTVGVYIGKVCLGLLKPVIPNTVSALEKIINGGREFSFANVVDPLPRNVRFEAYEHLFSRIEEESVKRMMEESIPAIPKNTKSENASTIDLDQFMKVDLRAAKVIDAQEVKDSDKLIACTLDLGPLGKRMVFSGLRPHVEPAQLLGKTVVVVANLSPRKMRFGVSEGMILACGEDKPTPIFLEGAIPGERIR